MVLGIAAALIIAEVALRLVAPQITGPVGLAPDSTLGAVPAPGLRGRKTIPGVYSYTFSHTPDGLRTTPASGGDDAPEILLLGDSFAYGMGVDDDQTVGNALVETLAARGMTVRLSNAARTGAAPDYALRLFRERAWRPSVVLYGFCYNDFGNLQAEPFSRVDSAGTIHPIPPQMPYRVWMKLRLGEVPGYNTLRSHSHVVGLLASVSAMSRRGDALAPHEYDMDTLAVPTHYAREREAERGRVYLEALRDESKSRGARFLSFYFPSAAQVAAYRRTNAFSTDEAIFLRILRSLKTDGMTLTPDLARSGLAIPEMYFPETHWRPVGHALAARGMADAVQAALCVQSPGLEGCATAPPAVRQIVEMRVGRASGG